MTLLATPLYRTTNAEPLEVADVYKITNTAPINKLFEAAKSTGSKVLDLAGGTENLIRGVGQLITMQKQGFTGRELISQGLGLFGTSQRGILGDLGGGVLDKAGEYIGMDPGMMNRMKIIGTQAAEMALTRRYDDPYQINGLISILGELSGNESIIRAVNIGLEAAVWGSTLTNAVNYRMYDAIGSYKHELDPDVYRQALIYSAGSVMMQGNLKALVEIMKELSAEDVLSSGPDYIKTFLMAYKLEDDTDPAEYPVQAALLTETMGRLNSRWYQYKRAEAWVFNYGVLSSLSDDGRKVLQLLPEFRDAIIAAPAFPIQSTYQILKDMYPMSVASLQ